MSFIPSARLAEARSISSREKRLVTTCLGMVVLVAVLVAILAPREDNDDLTPSSYASTSHGTKAAYLALADAGYRIERWERPLPDLTAETDAHTILILAEPWTVDAESQSAVKTILDRGGHVLATGVNGAALLPGSEGELNPSFFANHDCAAQPEGFDALAAAGTPHLRPIARWKTVQPNQRAEYYCDDLAAVVTYPVGRGTVVWWASSMPLENASIARDGDLSLLLASLGPIEQTRIVWDESLHQSAPGLWSYAEGTPAHLLWIQLAFVAILLVLSFSRRSGPLVPDPVVWRDQSLEFVSSLGALYDKACASEAAVKAASDSFHLSLGRTLRRGELEELVSVANARAGRSLEGLRETLTECDEAENAIAGSLSPARALRLVQKLWSYEREVRSAHLQLQLILPRKKTK